MKVSHLIFSSFEFALISLIIVLSLSIENQLGLNSSHAGYTGGGGSLK